MLKTLHQPMLSRLKFLFIVAFVLLIASCGGSESGTSVSSDISSNSSSSSSSVPTVAGSTQSDATIIALNASDTGTFTSKFNSENVVDLYQVYIATSGVYTISTSGAVDTTGSLMSLNGTVIASDDDSGSGSNFTINYELTAASGGFYYIEVRGYDSTAIGDYTLSIRLSSVTGDGNAGGSDGDGSVAGNGEWCSGRAAGGLRYPCSVVHPFTQFERRTPGEYFYSICFVGLNVNGKYGPLPDGNIEWQINASTTGYWVEFGQNSVCREFHVDDNIVVNIILTDEDGGTMRITLTHEAPGLLLGGFGGGIHLNAGSSQCTHITNLTNDEERAAVDSGWLVGTCSGDFKGYCTVPPSGGSPALTRFYFSRDHSLGHEELRQVCSASDGNYTVL